MWNSNVLQAGAPRKGKVSNFGHTIWNSNVLQAGASFKGRVSNRGHAIWYQVGANNSI